MSLSPNGPHLVKSKDATGDNSPSGGRFVPDAQVAKPAIKGVAFEEARDMGQNADRTHIPGNADALLLHLEQGHLLLS